MSNEPIHPYHVLTVSPAGEKLLPRLRKICLGMADSREIVQFTHPVFQVRKKTKFYAFCMLGDYKGEVSFVVRVEKSMQPVFLEDSRFFRTPYMFHQGWISLRVDGKVDWNEVTELIRGSYELTLAVKK